MRFTSTRRRQPGGRPRLVGNMVSTDGPQHPARRLASGCMWFSPLTDRPCNLYTDGALKATDTGFVFGTDIMANSAAPLFIGNRKAGGLAFNGAIDEVAIYDYALTETQITNHWSYIWAPAAMVTQPPASPPTSGPRSASRPRPAASQIPTSGRKMAWISPRSTTRTARPLSEWRDQPDADDHAGPPS